MNFEDICKLDILFEKIMADAQNTKTREEIIAIIQAKWDLIKEQKKEALYTQSRL